MKIRTMEEFHEHQRKTCKLYPQYYDLKVVEEKLVKVEENRAEVQNKLPYGLIVEAHWPEYDVANRWCWQHFGSKDGQCGEYCSEYPGCPLVLETKYMEKRPPHIAEEDWEEEWYGYRNPGEHSHEGNWTCIHFAKTGYDYGFGEYRFANETDRDALALVIEGLGMGERY